MIFSRLVASDNLINVPEAWTPIVNVYGGVRSSSGQQVSGETALGLSAYHACLRVLHDDIGKMPFQLIQKKTKQEAATRNILEAPHQHMSGQIFRGLLTHWAAGWGIGAAEIELDGAGRPFALHPIHPSRITVQRDQETGRMFYRVHNDNGKPPVDFDPSDLFLVFGMGPDGYTGYSVAHYGKDTIGLGLAADDFAASYYKNGGGINVAIKMPRTLSAEAKAAFRDSWLRRHAGSRNAGKPALLEDGMELERYDIPANEAQMLESRQFQVEEVARWFRISPVKIGHNQNVPFANIEAINIQHVNDALMPWVVRWENEANRKLLTQQQRWQVEYQGRTSELMRGDTATRGAYYRNLFSLGAMSPDDIRRAEGAPEIGSEASASYYMQGAMATIDDIFDGKQQSNAELPQGNPGRPSREETEQILRPILFASLQMVERKDAKARANKSGLDPEAYAEWAARFHVEQQRYLRQLLQPAVDSMRAYGDLNEAADAVVQWIGAGNDSDDLCGHIVNTFLDELGL